MFELPLEKGDTAELVAIEGDRGTVRSPMASAPGSRLGMRVDGRTIRLKVHSCRKEGERFTITGRFIDLTRDLRERLASAVSVESEPAATPAGDP